MLYRVIYIILFASSVFCRHVPRFSELDEDDQHLVRAAYDNPAYDTPAYDTPAYNQDEYQTDDDLPLGKLDLLKDGLWALKAKVKELKAFNKAMVANLLATKLKVKELLASSMMLKNHHHINVNKKKPSYNYQASSYSQYHAQPSQYAAQSSQYAAQPSQYAAQPLQYTGTGGEYAEPQYAPPQHTHDPYYGH